MSTFAWLAKELQKLYPGELRQLLQGQYSVTAVKAATAMAAAWVADVSSLDEQRAAVRRREEDVAQEKAAVQQLILAVAGMAKAARGQLEERPNKKQKRNPEPKT
jgi:predicted nucleotidyltransferase